MDDLIDSINDFGFIEIRLWLLAEVFFYERRAECFIKILPLRKPKFLNERLKG
jgi:hypothetical protein